MDHPVIAASPSGEGSGVDHVWVLTRCGDVVGVYASKAAADQAMWLAVGQDTRDLDVLLITAEYDLRRYAVQGDASAVPPDLTDW